MVSRYEEIALERCQRCEVLIHGSLGPMIDYLCASCRMELKFQKKKSEMKQVDLEFVRSDIISGIRQAMMITATELGGA